MSNDYGNQDTTFNAVGGEAGIAKLVDVFYDIMESNPAYTKIWHWHPKDSADKNRPEGAKPKQLTRDKLSAFLCGWMGGPHRFHEKFGSIHIPNAHAHLPVTTVERDMWLNCMGEALHRQAYSEELIEYLLRALSVPANRIFATCQSKAAW